MVEGLSRRGLSLHALDALLTSGVVPRYMPACSWLLHGDQLLRQERGAPALVSWSAARDRGLIEAYRVVADVLDRRDVQLPGLSDVLALARASGGYAPPAPGSVSDERAARVARRAAEIEAASAARISVLRSSRWGRSDYGDETAYPGILSRAEFHTAPPLRRFGPPDPSDVSFTRIPAALDCEPGAFRTEALLRSHRGSPGVVPGHFDRGPAQRGPASPAAAPPRADAAYCRPAGSFGAWVWRSPRGGDEVRVSSREVVTLPGSWLPPYSRELPPVPPAPPRRPYQGPPAPPAPMEWRVNKFGGRTSKGGPSGGRAAGWSHDVDLAHRLADAISSDGLAGYRRVAPAGDPAQSALRWGVLCGESPAHHHADGPEGVSALPEELVSAARRAWSACMSLVRGSRA